jgi:hypothetical protein
MWPRLQPWLQCATLRLTEMILNDNDEPFPIMEKICSRNGYITEDKIKLVIRVCGPLLFSMCL